MEPTPRSERGQGTVEYAGLVLVVAVLVTGLAAVAGPGVPGGELARAIAAKLLCAVRLSGSCGTPASELQRLFGAEVAAAVVENAPRIAFEDADVVSIPVDFRSCRSRACSDTMRRRSLAVSHSGEPATAFVHAIDCRSPDPEDPRCAGERAGRLYLQYWLYYPDSATRAAGRTLPRAYHRDDWESYQVRINPDGSVEARASSHHGHNHHGGAAGWRNDAGIRATAGWGPRERGLWVSADSHAGRVRPPLGSSTRRIPPRHLRLIPIEALDRRALATRFDVTPPWRKRLWRDPEAAGTG